MNNEQLKAIEERLTAIHELIDRMLQRFPNEAEARAGE